MSGSLGERVGMKHGAGGRAMRALIEQVFVAGFATGPDENVGLAAMDDGAALRVGDRWLVITTDSHVVQPLFFPGGDIGRLAVSGTVNDLAMMGATEPLALTCARHPRRRLLAGGARARFSAPCASPARRRAPGSSPATPR